MPGFKKGHTTNVGKFKIVKMCKRCDKHGIANNNNSGLCGHCSYSIHSGRYYRLNSNAYLISIR